jgi:hypothetical protein|tara:strand:- start:482 stop:592 length:111 start_codon:yes stop_codon:yes gene_type:complete
MTRNRIKEIMSGKQLGTITAKRAAVAAIRKDETADA